MQDTNKRLAAIFREMSDMYKYMGKDERFRALAYQKASRIIENFRDDLSEYDQQKKKLEDIPGIGESIAEKILEYIQTGKIQKYEALKKNTPHNIMELLQVTGFGPESLRKIHSELGINTKEELINALQDGRIARLKGFGQKKVENMLRGLKLHKTLEERMLLWDALELGNKVITHLKPLKEIKLLELAGSLRRKKETIGDIDVLASCNKKDRAKVINTFTDKTFAREVLAQGDTKASIIMKESERQVDLRIIDTVEWGSALQYFTGSKEHNVHLRLIAKEKGFKISEYGIFSIKSNKRIAGERESDIYETLGFQYMPPEMREDKGELELAMQHVIPRLISVDDIRGDLHTHSNWSDGLHKIEEIATYLLKNYAYDYFALTDHSKSARIAGGMSEKEILEQIAEIDKINQKLGMDFIKKGVEVDILVNGKLDFSDEILARLDWVIASVHSNFNRDNTDRIIRACENPFVCCIGHPTGRLIGSREPYNISLNDVMDAARSTHTALEINAQPHRMDLKDEYVDQARKKGVKLVISTDSHTLANFEFIRLGVFIARRAWCGKNDILNTRSWEEIQKFTSLKREKAKQPA